MKDIYDYLNDVDMDVSQLEQGSATDMEKKKVKMALSKRIKTHKPPRWKKALTAASASIGISAAALFGLSFTTFAEEIPIIGNVFKLFNGDGLYETYGDHSEKLLLSEEDNGIRITMDEVIFDGKALYLAYTIESDKDLGESPTIEGMPYIQDSDEHIYGSSTDIIRSSGNKYVGMTTGELMSTSGIDEGSFELAIKGIIPDPSLNMETITGDWAFQFELQATENKEQIVDITNEKNGVTIAMDKVVYTPMSFLLYYDEILSNDVMGNWDFITMRLVVKDNLGNEYTNKHNGGYSNSSHLLHHTNTFELLHPEATKLIITPTVEFSDGDTFHEYGAISRSENSTAPMEEFVMEDIIITIDK